MNRKSLIKRMLREFVEERKLRLYSLDWDDNILGMPTKIYLKGENGGVIGMATDDFAEYRHLIGKEPFEYEGATIIGFDDNAYRDFVHPKTFLSDTIKAVKKDRFSPSFKKFKETLIYANHFSIITARGHNPDVIKEGVKIFIDIVLTTEEKLEMIENIKDTINFEELGGFYKLDNLSDEQLIDIYLDEKGEYYPVSSKEFGQRFKLDSSGGASSPEHSKKIALSDFLEQVYNKVGKLIQSGKYGSVSLGFSDDDSKNVKSIIEHIEEELIRIYPEVHFVVFDTSEGGMKKIVIKRVQD